MVTVSYEVQQLEDVPDFVEEELAQTSVTLFEVLGVMEEHEITEDEFWPIIFLIHFPCTQRKTYCFISSKIVWCRCIFSNIHFLIAGLTTICQMHYTNRPWQLMVILSSLQLMKRLLHVMAHIRIGTGKR